MTVAVAGAPSKFGNLKITTRVGADIRSGTFRARFDLGAPCMLEKSCTTEATDIPRLM